MMTSTFPTSKSDQGLKNGVKEIAAKKEALVTLEVALKKRINEFKELCLKEGELIGHLPIDYPLQPREPIPQIRRRIHHSSSSGHLDDNSNSIRARQHKIAPVQPQSAFAITSNPLLPPFPSRPTSTNSTSSSISTASSNTRSNNLVLNHSNGHHMNFTAPPSSSSSSNQSSMINGHCFNNIHAGHGASSQHNRVPSRYDQSLIPNHMKRAVNLPASFDAETMGHIRASSTASSSSSSGSGVSSTLSASTVPTTKNAHGEFNVNFHARSYSESLSTSDSTMYPSHHSHPRSHQATMQRQIFKQPLAPLADPSLPPPRPPRGHNNNVNGQVLTASSTINGINCGTEKRLAENDKTVRSENGKTNSSSSLDALSTTKHFNINGVGNFQPYYEETKPFQMSDFYKYSAKHRQRTAEIPTHPKTTRQLQEDVLKKNSSKFSPCDDQIQASVKLIERSGQKLIEATAKAIASNPSLAEKINNILPNNGDRQGY